MESIWLSLQITVVGMGLVFVAILLLWEMIALLVKFTSSEQVTQESDTPPEKSFDELELKKRVAAAAVALAMAMRRDQPSDNTLHEFPLPPTAIVSPWQAVMRANMLNKRGHVR